MHVESQSADRPGGPGRRPRTPGPLRSTEQVVDGADGGRCRLTRIGEHVGPPVVLLPGMFDNRRLYLGERGRGLAGALVDAGYDPWILERRGIGVPGRSDARAGWDEALVHDLPAAQRIVTTSTGQPARWIGHSFGGTLLARALAETLDLGDVGGAILICAALEIPLLENRVVASVFGGRAWGGSFPARRLGMGPENEPAAAIADARRWVRQAAGIYGRLAAVHVPLLAITGPRDPITPASRCARLADAFGSTDALVQSASRSHGFSRNHGHESALLHPAAATDVFPFVVRWLVERDGTGA